MWIFISLPLIDTLSTVKTVFDLICLSPQDKYFQLEKPTNPKIVVKNLLDFDVVQKISLVLHVQVWPTWQYWRTECVSSSCHAFSPVFQDTFNGSASNDPFFTSVATITVVVKDVDNRPPWFQPCLRTNLGNAKLCVSTGYKTKVNLTEKEVRDVQRESIMKAVLMVDCWALYFKEIPDSIRFWFFFIFGHN